MNDIELEYIRANNLMPVEIEAIVLSQNQQTESKFKQLGNFQLNFSNKIVFIRIKFCQE